MAGSKTMAEHANAARCCLPAQSTRAPAAPTYPYAANPVTCKVEHEDVTLPAATFEMGDALGDGAEADGEGPVHQVSLDEFRIDRTCVTNEQFARFVAATSHVTEAEKFGNSAVFAPFVAAERGNIVGYFGARWWLGVAGADWRHPFGPKSGIDDAARHPVVHVSYNDALAYCRWAGRVLPTEAEWEYAARGGHRGRRFPWGDELEPAGVHMANVWQGDFPSRNSAADGWSATAPVGSFPPNDFGLYDVIGNVWEWCLDWHASDFYASSPVHNPTGPNAGDRRVARGGSYLCHQSYCERYRLAARFSNTPESTAGNLGFRTVVRPNNPAWMS